MPSHAKGLTTLDDVRAHTKASASCGIVHGACRAAPGAQARRRLQPGCRATDVPVHRPRPRRRAPPDRRQRAQDDPRADAGAGMEDIVRVREVPSGAQLLPARHWPGEYVDDNQSRFINERVHANIQKDGTYLGRAAHVGRHDQRKRAARHRRRRRQVRDPDRESDRRPAHRHARRQEGGPARRLGRSQQGRDGFGRTPTPRACAR